MSNPETYSPNDETEYNSGNFERSAPPTLRLAAEARRAYRAFGAMMPEGYLPTEVDAHTVANVEVLGGLHEQGYIDEQQLETGILSRRQVVLGILLASNKANRLITQLGVEKVIRIFEQEDNHFMDLYKNRQEIKQVNAKYNAANSAEIKE